MRPSEARHAAFARPPSSERQIPKVERMNDHTDPEDSIEDRVETIEGEIDDIHFEKIEARIDVIEIEQELLRDDLDSVVESYRTDKGEIPHIDSVQALHNRLERIEENVATLRESLGDVVESGE